MAVADCSAPAKAIVANRRTERMTGLRRPTFTGGVELSTHQRRSQTSNHGRKADSSREFSVCLHGLHAAPLTARR